jgi:putative SOS response-associated peptidase YedK
MCYGVSRVKKSITQMEERFEAKYNPADHALFKNVYHESGFSRAKAEVITSQDFNAFQFFHWGLVPYWSQKWEDVMGPSYNTLNAKSETVFTTRSYQHCIETQRCLIPVSGFFESMDVKGKKYPHYIYLKNNDMFCLAGIYDYWTHPQTGEKIGTYSILTVEANELMAQIHNLKKRMPVIIPRELESAWVTPELTKSSIDKLMIQYPSDQMEAYPIPKFANSTKADRNVPEVLQPFHYPELNQQGGLF